MNQSAASLETTLREAVALHQRGQLADALARYDEILAVHSEFPDVLYLKGSALMASGDAQAAADCFARAFKAKPDNVDYRVHLALALLQLQQVSEAIEHLNAALALQPHHQKALAAAGWAYNLRGDNAQAEALIRQALKLDPNDAQSWINLGVIHKNQRRLDDAKICFEKAIALNPNLFEAYYNLSFVLHDQGKLEAALQPLQEAEKRGEQGAGRYNQSMLYFLLGNRAKALELWDWRWKNADASMPPWPFTRWQGQPLGDKKLLIWTEQGIGDELMLASHIAKLPVPKSQVILECVPRLVPIFKRSFDLEIAPYSPAGRTELSMRKDIAFHMPIGDLLHCSAAQHHYPLHEGYLKADDALVAEFREKYAVMNDKLKVGISWYSSNYSTGSTRSIRLRDWQPILDIPGVQFVNVQYGGEAEEAREFPSIHTDESVDAMKDMDRFAAQVASLDLVISVANSTVHMAGALGTPVWVLLPQIPSWRWEMGREDCRWYPHAKLIRQKKMFEWDEAIARTADALADYQAACKKR